jgi:hypothetical protein
MSKTSKVQLWSSLKISMAFRYHFFQLVAKPKGHTKDQIKHSVTSEKSNNYNYTKSGVKRNIWPVFNYPILIHFVKNLFQDIFAPTEHIFH